MTIVELKMFLNNAFIVIAEYMERLTVTFFSIFSKDDFQLGDIIFLAIIFLFFLSLVLSIVSSAISAIKFHKKAGLESYYLDQVAIQLKKNN